MRAAPLFFAPLFAAFAMLAVSAPAAKAVVINSSAEYIVTTSVNDTWKYVYFTNTYTDPVAVCTYSLPAGTNRPATVRITSLGPNYMQIKAQLFGITTPVSFSQVHCLIVEAGAHTWPDGTKLFAGHVFTNKTHGGSAPSGWLVADQVNITPYITNTLTNPILLASIMSFNDSRPSAPYVTDCDAQGNPPFMAGFSDGACVGLHIGRQNSSRTGETIGYIAIESGTGNFNGVSFTAGLTADAVVGPDVAAYSQSVPQTYSAAVLTLGAMDGGDGGWAVMRGTSPLAGSAIAMSIDEDQLLTGTNTRAHTTEQVAYFAVSATPLYLSFNAAVDITWTAESRTLTYTVTLRNNGSTTISNLYLEADLPLSSTTTFLTSPDAAINDGTPNALAPGETWTYTATVTPTQTYINNNINTSLDALFTVGSKSATAVTYIIAPAPDIRVLKYANKTQNVQVGETITYSIYVSNYGNVTMRNITLNDQTNGTNPTAPVPTNETIFEDNPPLNDTSDSAIDGKWDKLGSGDTVVFTSTYVVTQEDIETLQ